MLIAAKAPLNLNTQDNDGNTALIDAVKNDHKAIVQELITAGADAPVKNNAGNTARMIATQSGFTDITELLKKASK